MNSQTIAGDPGYSGGKAISEWEPENPQFWSTYGKRVATRNLWISIPALLLAFCVWMVWSVVVVRMNRVGFHWSTQQLFWLTALPGLSGASMRIFYAFIVPIVGGRRWTAISTATLLIPSIWMGFAVQDVHTSFTTLAIIALLCGFGGGNFASSMANISFFFPKNQQGTALGLNAGLGNLGVSVMQFLVPLVVTMPVLGLFGGAPLQQDDGHLLWLQNAAWIWIPCIVLITIGAWFGMNDLKSSRSSFSEQSVIFSIQHNWLVCWLYLATFGSFIGYAAALPMLIKAQFTGIDPLRYAFLGPFLGAVSRPIGGWLADRIGGATVTFWNFIVMIITVIGVLLVLPQHKESTHFAGFLGLFLILFITTGIGNGSIFRMIPIIFRLRHERLLTQAATDTERAQSLQKARMESAAVIGFSSAVAAFGAFFIPSAFGYSLKVAGTPSAAFELFIVFYLSCLFVSWWWYARKGAQTPC